VPGVETVPPVVFAIRFSVLERNVKNKYRRQAKSESFEDYKKTLFSQERLDRRFHSLVNVTLSSIAGQSDTRSTHVLIYTSEHLPEKYLSALRDTKTRFPFVEIITVSEDEKLDFDENLKKTCKRLSAQLYAHVRMDDDDAVARHFVERLRGYVQPHNIGYAISFGRGVAGEYDPPSGKYTGFFEFYRAKSVGLALVGGFDLDRSDFLSLPAGAFGLGAHSRADRRCPVILDSRETSFIYSIHPDQDSVENNSGRRSGFGNELSDEKIQELFALDASCLP